MAESAPLLDESHVEHEDYPNLCTEKPPTYLTILTIIALILSVVTVALLIANFIIAIEAPFTSYPWAARGACQTLGIWVFVSLIVSFINVLVNLPMLLNLIVDIVFASGVITCVFHLIDELPGDWCRQYRYPGDNIPEPNPKCKDWMLVVKILTGVAAGLGGILGFVYLTLLVLRTIIVIRSKLWRRLLTLYLPAGQVSFEIKLRFLRQEHGATGNPVGQGAEASSSSAHGPVYL